METNEHEKSENRKAEYEAECKKGVKAIGKRLLKKTVLIETALAACYFLASFYTYSMEVNETFAGDSFWNYVNTTTIAPIVENALELCPIFMLTVPIVCIFLVFPFCCLWKYGLDEPS